MAMLYNIVYIVPMKHKEIVEHFKSLPKREQNIVVKSLLDHLTSNEGSVYSIRESQVSKSGLICPSCSSKSIVGYGNYREVKRYRCKVCNKTFNTFSGTVGHWMHKKELLKQYLYLMLQGYSLRKIVAEMNICLKTAFDWRHKILNSLSSDEGSKLTGVVEADETFFLFSEKGNKQLDQGKARRRGGLASTKGLTKDHVAVLTTYERKSGDVIQTVVCKGRITKVAIQKGVGKWLDKEESILCTDSHKSFQGFALDNGIAHKRIFARRKEFVVDKIYHIQHVNNIHSNLKMWMIKFNGVATKYLQNYLNYFNLVQEISNSVDQAEKALESVLKQNNVFVKRNELNQQFCIT